MNKYDRDGKLKDPALLKNKEFLHKEKPITLGDVAKWKTKKKLREQNEK